MLRRRLAVLVAAAMMLASIGAFGAPALADAPENAHNCVGSETSTGTPQLVNHSQHGSFISGLATEDHGELGALQSQVSREANCGATGSQAHP